MAIAQFTTDAIANTVHIWTVQISNHRVAKREGIYLLDTTAKSGVPQFAPEYRQVMRYKCGEINEVEYTEMYEERMRFSLRTYPAVWEKLKSHPRVAVACYCSPGKFCHRHLFTDMMAKYLEREGYRPVKEGELLPPSKETKGI